MTLESTIIPRRVRVFSATYANLPTTGLVEEDLGYATDRLVLYRWDGSAWVAITIHASAGLAANIPTVADMPEGSIYHATDEAKVYMVESGAWVVIAEALVTLTSGTYNGDASVNKAIAHGLGKVPKIVIITCNDDSFLILKPDLIVNPNNSSSFAITAWTTTNFYVGNAAQYSQSANENTKPYYWAAIG